MEAVNKSVHDAILNHNAVFLNTFHNTMKEAIHGFLVGQVCTSPQEAAPAGNEDVQAVQSSSEQT